MKISKKVIFPILLFGAILLTGIWFWDRNIFLSKPSNFNNILSPIISFFALIVYSIALFTTINQNKIILSQNIKPHYEKEIKEYLIKAKNIKILYGFDSEQIEFNALNYMTGIRNGIGKIRNNEEYWEDIEKHKQKEEINEEYLQKRSYYGTLLFLSEFTLGVNPIAFFYNDLKQLIEEISLSKLIEEDKQLLKKRIHREFLAEYLAFIKHVRYFKPIMTQIPILYSGKKVIFKSISETEFGKNYDWFISELKVSEY